MYFGMIALAVFIMAVFKSNMDNSWKVVAIVVAAGAWWFLGIIGTVLVALAGIVLLIKDQVR